MVGITKAKVFILITVLLLQIVSLAYADENDIYRRFEFYDKLDYA